MQSEEYHEEAGPEEHPAGEGEVLICSKPEDMALLRPCWLGAGCVLLRGPGAKSYWGR